MTSQEKIDYLRKEATRLTGIPESLDKEYRRIFYIKEGKTVKQFFSAPYRSERKIL